MTETIRRAKRRPLRPVTTSPQVFLGVKQLDPIVVSTPELVVAGMVVLLPGQAEDLSSLRVLILLEPDVRQRSLPDTSCRLAYRRGRRSGARSLGAFGHGDQRHDRLTPRGS